MRQAQHWLLPALIVTIASCRRAQSRKIDPDPTPEAIVRPTYDEDAEAINAIALIGFGLEEDSGRRTLYLVDVTGPPACVEADLAGMTTSETLAAWKGLSITPWPMHPIELADASKYPGPFDHVVLITENELRSALAVEAGRRELFDWPESHGVIRLTNIAFDPGRRHALVGADVWLGDTRRGWVLSFRKLDGSWAHLGSARCRP